MNASASGVTRFVAPGPDVAIVTPTLPGRMCVSRRHVSTALFVARKDVADRAVVQRVVGLQDGTAGNTENEVDTFTLECLDQDFRSRELFCHVVLRIEENPPGREGSAHRCGCA